MSMQNVEYSVEDGKLYIEVDLSKSLGLSKSEKSTNRAIVFPSEPVTFEAWPGLRFNLTVLADPPKKQALTRQRMSR